MGCAGSDSSAGPCDAGIDSYIRVRRILGAEVSVPRLTRIADPQGLARPYRHYLEI